VVCLNKVYLRRRGWCIRVPQTETVGSLVWTQYPRFVTPTIRSCTNTRDRCKLDARSRHRCSARSARTAL